MRCLQPVKWSYDVDFLTLSPEKSAVYLVNVSNRMHKISGQSPLTCSIAFTDDLVVDAMRQPAFVDRIILCH